MVSWLKQGWPSARFVLLKFFFLIDKCVEKRCSLRILLIAAPEGHCWILILPTLHRHNLLDVLGQVSHIRVILDYSDFFVNFLPIFLVYNVNKTGGGRQFVWWLERLLILLRQEEFRRLCLLEVGMDRDLLGIHLSMVNVSGKLILLLMQQLRLE